MLNPLNPYHTFVSHPILSDIETFIKRGGNNATALNLLRRGTAFIYPNTICFSFEGYPKRINNLDLSKSELFDYKLFKKPFKGIPKSSYSDFLQILGTYFRNKPYSPIFVFDLRFSNKLYKSVISNFINEFSSDLISVVILAFEGSSLSNLQNSFSDNSVCYTEDVESLYDHIELLSTKKEYTLQLDFPERITIKAFGNLIKKSRFYEQIGKKLVVALDFNRTHYINTFALCLLNVFMRSVSPDFGVRWTFFNIDKKKDFFKKFDEFRTFKINSFFLNLSYDQIYDQEENVRRFGVYLFNKRLRSFLNERFTEYLLSIRRMFPDYLDQNITTTYQYPNSSYKPVKNSMSRYNYLSMVCSELIENATIHSGNTGYLAAELSNYVLKIFIGDCGIGLRDGILKNYDLGDILRTNEDAIKYAFSLTAYSDFRIKKGLSDDGAGFGLADTLIHIFNLKGKFIFRTQDTWGAFVNPVSKSHAPSKVLPSYSRIRGTQYLIVIPLSIAAQAAIPRGATDFLEMGY